jgi:hypothetical protein
VRAFLLRFFISESDGSFYLSDRLICSNIFALGKVLIAVRADLDTTVVSTNVSERAAASQE